MVKASIPAGGSLSMHYCHIHDIWMGSDHTRNGGRFISTRTIPTQTGPTTGGSAVRFQSALIFVTTNMLAPSQHTPLLECIIHMAWVCGCQPTAPTAFPVLPGSVLLARPACCALANASSSPGTPLTPPLPAEVLVHPDGGMLWEERETTKKYSGNLHTLIPAGSIVLGRKIHRCGMPLFGWKNRKDRIRYILTKYTWGDGRGTTRWLGTKLWGKICFDFEMKI